MACLIAPATAALVVTTIKKKIPAKYHPEWLLLMMWGGVLMLIVDHIANGEIVPYFPFFTSDKNIIWTEIIKNGVPMTIVIFAFWATAVWISIAYSKRKLSSIEG
ncbi:MAG: hypothetical protein WC107_00565 [Patescibacteria group bacterium]